MRSTRVCSGIPERRADSKCRRAVYEIAALLGTSKSDIYPTRRVGTVRTPHLYRAAQLKCDNSGRLLPRRWSRRGSRKRGLKHAEVVTAWLVQDERGWVRVAG